MSDDWCGLHPQASDEEALRNIVRDLRERIPRPRKLCVVEIGSYVGRSAIAMLQGCADEVHCIDTWKGSTDSFCKQAYANYGGENLFKQFCLNVGPGQLFTSVFPHVGDSRLYAQVWPWKVDMVYIDADHEYESVLADIRAWTPHVRSGGIVAGHDYEPYFPGVVRAVDETGGCTKVGCSTWYRRKD